MKKLNITDDAILAAYGAHAGSLGATARYLGISRGTVYSRLRKLKALKKPLTGGSTKGRESRRLSFPSKGKVKRYIFTSAQNNTKVNLPVWNNLKALAKHYDAEIIIGTFSYNQNAFGKLAVKRGTEQHDNDLWFDPELEPYFNDDRLEVGHGLVWCGEFNSLPTDSDPLSGLETYSQRKSAIFPHAKLAMRSIPTMRGEGTKLNYTTGTVTMMNYIQKKAGLKGEHHHIYGGLLVEVDDKGRWWVRQLVASQTDQAISDLDLVVRNGRVIKGQRIESITWGDIHATMIHPDVKRQSMEMLDHLEPFYQFFHDVCEGAGFNHHTAGDCHARFKVYKRGLFRVQDELAETAKLLGDYERHDCIGVVVYANHDEPWLYRWLREHDYRRDPHNAILFLKLQTAVYEALEDDADNFNLLAYALRLPGIFDDRMADLMYLSADDSFKTCHSKIENGMHGHLGPNGSRGTPRNLNTVGRRANTGHTHVAGIFNGLYVAGTSTKLKWDYTKGPSSWTHSHIVTYPNGTRTIVTMWDGKWRA